MQTRQINLHKLPKLIELASRYQKDKINASKECKSL
jgi:hypothetical protein